MTTPQRTSVADLTSQLTVLRCDLERFCSARSSSKLTEAIRDRIKEIEGHLARARAGEARAPEAPVEPQPAFYAKSSRFPARH